MGDFLLLLIGLLAGSLLLTVLVAALVVPPLRRLGRARAGLSTAWSQRMAVIRALGLERRMRG